MLSLDWRRTVAAPRDELSPSGVERMRDRRVARVKCSDQGAGLGLPNDTRDRLTLGPLENEIDARIGAHWRGRSTKTPVRRAALELVY